MNVTEIEAEIQKIKQAADALAGVHMAGLTFSVEAGVAAGTSAAADVNALSQAWGALVAGLTELQNTVTHDTEAELKKKPCLSELKLAAAIKAWSEITDKAHTFMMNFYVMP